jgi:dethiobiotin synthetase
VGLKPVETGIEEGAEPADAAALERRSFHVKHPRPHPLYAFRDPVTPALAARRERTTIDLQRIRRWVDDTIADESTSPLHTVIETAGGVFSPLADGVTNLDLANALGPATWLLVATDRLGVLHDVSSTLEAMRARGATADQLILSAPAVPDASTGTNADELRRIPGMPPILELARNAASSLSALLDPIAH